MMRPTNPDATIGKIRQSSDMAWLEQYRSRMFSISAGDIVQAIDLRLIDLRQRELRKSLEMDTTGFTLAERVQEAIRVDESFLALSHHGKKVKAVRTRAMVKKWGEKGTVARSFKAMTESSGLDLLSQYGRLDCSYEQIVLDFEDEFEASLVEKARSNLAHLASAHGERDLTAIGTPTP